MRFDGAVPQQSIGFARSADGVRIAHATLGQGPPMVVDVCWVSQLEYDLQSPVWCHFVKQLASMATVHRYDERGFGLSDWDVPSFDFESRVADLEAVADANGLDRFALLGMAQGGPVAVAYAHRHPERVSRLILLGTWASMEPDEIAMDEAMNELFLLGWGRPEHRFRHLLTDMFMPGASEEQMRWMDELMRRTTTPENAVAYRRARVDVDVRSLLPELRVPTLVVHARGDQVNPFDGSRQIAAAIPGARFVALDSDNHVLLEDDPATAVFFGELRHFLAPDAHRNDRVVSTSQPPARDTSLLETLSPRERDVIALVAAGRDNAEIARQLSLSVRTVERHLQTIYRKLGLEGSAQRTAAAALVLGAGTYA